MNIQLTHTRDGGKLGEGITLIFPVSINDAQFDQLELLADNVYKPSPPERTYFLFHRRSDAQMAIIACMSLEARFE